MPSHKALHKKSRSTNSLRSCISPCTSRPTLPYLDGEGEGEGEGEEEEVYRPPSSIPQAPSIGSGDKSSLLYDNFEPIYDEPDLNSQEGNFSRDYSGRKSLRDRIDNPKSTTSMFNARSSLRLPSNKTPLDQYINQLSTTITSNLTETNDSNGWQQKKRMDYNKELKAKLKKRMNKEETRTEKFDIRKILSPNRLTGIGVGAGIGLGIASVLAAGGATATAGLATFATLFSIAAYVAYKTFSTYIKNKDANNLLQFSPHMQDEDIIDLISILTTLYTVDLLNTELKEKFNLKNQINPKKLLNYLTKLQQEEKITEDWDKEIRVIHKWVNKDSKLIIENLKKVVKNNKPGSVPQNPKLPELLIPNKFYDTGLSKNTLQKRKALAAWLTALEMTIRDKKDISAQASFQQKLNSITSNEYSDISLNGSLGSFYALESYD